jgi:hypothetical protein
MKDARIQKIMEGLKGSTEQRAEAWEMFCHSCSDLDLDDLKFRRVLEALIRKPTDDATRELQELRFELHRLIDLVAVRPWARRPKAPLEDWFFRPFRPTPRLSNPCGVVGICDREYIRDVQAQILLARRLSIERYPDTKFCYLALSNPVWSDVELERINALCVLGRPSMFARCAILEALAEQRRSARFALPGDNDRWRGQPLTPDSAAIFHHVVQRSPWGEPKLYGAVDQNGSRTDYALVQRFRILYSGRPVTIIVLAGATSLGTIGAVDWVAGSGLVNALKAGCHWLGKSDLAEDSEVEALLRVRADVRNPARPWGHVECAPVKLFIDDSVNLAPGESPAEPVAPKIVTTMRGNGSGPGPCWTSRICSAGANWGRLAMSMRSPFTCEITCRDAISAKPCKSKAGS